MAISIVNICFMLTISIVSVSQFPTTQAGTNGFTIDLIHRDSPQSPYHDPSLSPYQLTINALRRSTKHPRHSRRPRSTQDSPVTDIISDGGEYLVKFSVGTPPGPTIATFDTGSDLTWTQCQPCLSCFKQKYPIFTPKKSSTYKQLPCNSPLCKAFPLSKCGNRGRTCVYSQSYADQTFTEGDLSTETITLDSTDRRKISIPNVVIGCGHRNDGVFSAGGSGIAGFGSGKVSFISQLGPLGQGKFSYCLVPFSSTTANSSKLRFGNDAVVYGSGVFSSPLVVKPGRTFYYLALEGVSVGNQRFEFDSISPNARVTTNGGNIIIDSGTTLTLLPPSLYQKIKGAMMSVIKLRQVEDPNKILKLCYNSPNDIRVPVVTFHFRGADVKLNTVNTFVRVSETTVCLAFAPAVDTPIFGSLAQANFLIGYDLNKKTISFKPTDCTKS